MPRLSLTPRQLSTPAGAALLEICTAITEDGVVTDEELNRLGDWLQANSHVDLPARSHLATIVEQIRRDGIVSEGERRELQRAVEAVLPTDARTLARLRRREREETERTARKEEAERAREEKARNRPIGNINFMVAGVNYEGRSELIARHVRTGDPAFLRRDLENRFSRNAVEVRTADGYHIGFVPERDAQAVAGMLDDGALQAGNVLKILGSGRAPIPVVQVTLFSADATLPNLVRQADIPVIAAPPAAALTASRLQSVPRRPSEGARPNIAKTLVWLIAIILLLAVIFC
jgi:hypothetical protein